MFLDDKLIEMCKKSDLETPESIQKLNKDICDECSDYYKSKITKKTTNKEVKVILDRTFKLFDSFVKTALNSKDKKLNILGDMFESFSFKDQFLGNEKMAEIYNKL